MVEFSYSNNGISFHSLAYFLYIFRIFYIFTPLHLHTYTLFYTLLYVFTEDISLHKQLITQILTRVPPELFSEFLRVYLLQTNQTPLRTQTHSLVLTMYDQGTDREKNNLLKLLWPLWPQLSQYGKKG